MARSSSARCCWRSARSSWSRLRHRWLAPLRAADPRRVRGRAPRRPPGLDHRRRDRAWSSSSSWDATAGSKTPDGWVSGGWNWSDLLVHVAIGSSIAAGNFPPEVPYFAGVPLTYHWFADFHGAIASTVAGLDIIPVYFATSALFAAVLALVVWALAIRLTGDRRVATIATILVVLRRRAGLDPARRRRHGRAPATSLDLVSQHLVRQHLGGRLAVLQDRIDLRDRVPAAPGDDAGPAGAGDGRAAGRRPAWVAGRSGSCWPGSWPRCSRRSSSSPSRRRTSSSFLYVVTTGAWRARTVVRDAVLFLAPVVLAAPFIAGGDRPPGRRRGVPARRSAGARRASATGRRPSPSST